MRGESLRDARALVEEGLRDWQLFAEHDAGGWASAQALIALTLMDADDRALEVIDELAVRALRAGALIGTLTAIGHRGWISARRGDLARRRGRDAHLHGRQRAERDVACSSPAWRCSSSTRCWSVPRSATSPRWWSRSELTPGFLATCGGAMLLEARGRLRIRRGDRDGGIADLRACGQVYAGLRFGPPLTFWRSALALALPADARDEALALITLELTLASATGLARAQGIALRAAGLLAGGERGLDYLRQSVTTLDGTAARLEHARAYVDYGAALRRAGQRSQAREPLATGLELAHHCGADRLAGRALEEIRAAGARPRRIARTGLDALTASELRTARLVAQDQLEHRGGPGPVRQPEDGRDPPVACLRQARPGGSGRPAPARRHAPGPVVVPPDRKSSGCSPDAGRSALMRACEDMRRSRLITAAQ